MYSIICDATKKASDELMKTVAHVKTLPLGTLSYKKDIDMLDEKEEREGRDEEGQCVE
jgi:hypothetical protein